MALWVEDDYRHLPAKGLAFYQYALEHYDFDWLFKCDDDTWLALDRLESLCDGRYDQVSAHWCSPGRMHGPGATSCRTGFSRCSGMTGRRKLWKKTAADFPAVRSP